MPEQTHGGTDGGPPPRYDFSSNANALGPDPALVAALRAVDPGPYPDPTYTALREALAAAHGVHPDAIVVGAGASELILRLALMAQGPVLVPAPGFGEYRRAAEVAARPVITASSPDEFLARLPGAALAFLACPTNPEGAMLDADLCRAIVACGASRRVVVDRAYSALSQAEVRVPEGSWQLFSPGKASGITGVRAGYLVADRPAGPPVAARAPAWALSAHGEALLRACLKPSAQAWVRRTRPTLWRWRDRLAAALEDLGLPVRRGAANFLLVRVGDATRIAGRLRAQRIRVRDATSFGLPAWLRLSAQPPRAQDALVAMLGSG